MTEDALQLLLENADYADLLHAYVRARTETAPDADADAEGAGLDAVIKDVAMHVAAADPTPVAADTSGVASDLLEQERAIYRRQAEQEGKPAGVIARIVDGKLKKFLKEVCLVEQPFVKDPDRSVKQFLADSARELGAELSVSGFVRLRLGETNQT